MSDDLINHAARRLGMELPGTIGLIRKLSDRIEQLEAALFHYSCSCDDGQCDAELLDMPCGAKARAALEGKKDE